MAPSVNASFMRAVNRVITENNQVIQMYVEREHENKRREYEWCRMNLFLRESRSLDEPIGLWRLGEAFVVLAYALSICLLTLICEKLVYLFQ